MGKYLTIQKARKVLSVNKYELYSNSQVIKVMYYIGKTDKVNFIMTYYHNVCFFVTLGYFSISQVMIYITP